MTDHHAVRFDPVAEIEAVHADLAEWLGSDAGSSLDRFAATQHETATPATQ